MVIKRLSVAFWITFTLSSCTDQRGAVDPGLSPDTGVDIPEDSPGSPEDLTQELPDDPETHNGADADSQVTPDEIDLLWVDELSPEIEDAVRPEDILQDAVEREDVLEERPLDSELGFAEMDGDTGESPFDPYACWSAGEESTGEESQPRFVDISHTADAVDIFSFHASRMSGGVAISDFNGDERPDLVVGSDGGLFILENDEGRFLDKSVEYGLSDWGMVTSLAFGDLENDGDQDLLVGGYGSLLLFINDGTGHFTEEGFDWGFRGIDEDLITASMVLFDFDGDGWLDFYQTGYGYGDSGFEGQPNTLWMNMRGEFIPVLESPGGEDAAAPTLSATAEDFNGDGFADIWLAHDFGPMLRGNDLYLGGHNGDPWQFLLAGSEFGFDQAVFGMSTTLGDFDNDGDLDGYVTNIANNLLLVVDGETGHAVDQGAHFGATVGHTPHTCPSSPAPPYWPELDPEDPDPTIAALALFCEQYCEADSGEWVLVSWASLFFDADHNGMLDLFVANGNVGLGPQVPEAEGQLNDLLSFNGVRFESIAEAVLPQIRGSSRGAAVGDLDIDGDLDLVWIDNGYDGDGGLRIMENQMSDGDWLEVKLVGSRSNRDAIGSRLTLSTSSGDQLRHISGGQTYLSQSERFAHFGFSPGAIIESLRVVWPSGMETVLDADGVGRNRRVILEEP